MLYYLFQVFGASAFGFVMDLKRFRRRDRAWVGLGFVAVLCMAVWGGSYDFQKGYTRADIGVIKRIDFRDGGYARHVVLYIWYEIRLPPSPPPCPFRRPIAGADPPAVATFQDGHHGFNRKKSSASRGPPV